MIQLRWEVGDYAEIHGRRGEIAQLVEHIDGEHWAVLHMVDGKILATAIRSLNLPLTTQRPK